MANLTDFFQLLKDLDNCYSDAWLVKPNFVKSILPSHVYYYAIMCGDELTHDHYRELISSLSLCIYFFENSLSFSNKAGWRRFVVICSDT